MGSGIGTNIIHDGLIFAIDMNNIKKSWKGEPTINYIYFQNPRIDENYAPYVNTTSGSWEEHHPDAITVYGLDGVNHSNYVNGGVTDYTNTYHAIWTYDDILRKPVVTMRDFDGMWKAKSSLVGKSMTDMGLDYGDTYTISWLQWTDNLTRGARVGLYGKDLSDAYGFHDGCYTVLNTRLYTWERIAKTYTVSSNWNLTTSLRLYMYGHSSPPATIKISDVQLETKEYASNYYNGYERTSTNNLIDMISHNSLPMDNIVYNSNKVFEFNGVDSYIDSGFGNGINPSTYTFSFTIWVRTNAPASNKMFLATDNYGTDQRCYFGIASSCWCMGIRDNTWGNGVVPVTTDWTHVGVTFDGSIVSMYINGEFSHAKSYSSYTLLSNLFLGKGNGYNWDGQINNLKIYNKSLTENEIKRNYMATYKAYVPYLYYSEGSRADLYIEHWDNSIVYSMKEFGGLGYVTAHGYVYGPETYTLILNNLPKHSAIRYKVYWHMVDSLDSETSNLDIDTVNVLTFVKKYNLIPSITNSADGVTTDWNGNKFYTYAPWAGNPDSYNYGYLIIDTGYIEHINNSVEIKNVMGANQAQSDEAMYLSHVEVWIKP